MIKTMWPLLMLGVGCDNGALFTIDVSESATAEIPGSGPLGDVTNLVGDLGFGGFAEMNIVESEELANQGISPGDIEEASLSAFSLTVEAPTDGDLSFIESMDVFVESPDLPKELVASQTAFDANSVTFDLVALDLTSYIVSESLTITTDVSGTPPEEDTTIRADIVLTVGVTAQGAKNAASQ